MSQSIPAAARKVPLGAGDRDDDDGWGPPPSGLRRTRRWRGVTGLTLLAVGVGLLVQQPAALLAGVFGVAFAAYGQIGRAPNPTLSVERRIEDPEPEPGDEVAVELTVTNEGDGRLADLRVIDGVPDGLAVVDGSPRLATSLRPGEGAHLEYEIEAVRGGHRFDPVVAICRDVPGATERVVEVEPSGPDDAASPAATDGGTAVAPEEEKEEGVEFGDDDSAPEPPATTDDGPEPDEEAGRWDAAPPLDVSDGQADRIVCVPPFPAEPPSFPLRAQTTRYTGRTAAEEGGDGVEFHATREYRVGDPLSRIDWKRTARTRDLTTVEYRRERAASVLLVVDARREAYAAPEPDEESAVDRCVEAATAVAAALLEEGHSVGLTAFSPTPPWLAPGRGAEHRLRLRRTLAAHEAFGRAPPEDDVNAYGAGREIRTRIAEDTQIVLFSPLLDDDGGDAAHRFEAHGHLTTVVAPDPCVTETVGQRVEAISRSMRVAGARHGGVPTVDWRRGEGFERALARSHRRWSA